MTTSPTAYIHHSSGLVSQELSNDVLHHWGRSRPVVVVCVGEPSTSKI